MKRMAGLLVVVSLWSMCGLRGQGWFARAGVVWVHQRPDGDLAVAGDLEEAL
jgi:hypothetical protein